MIFTIFEAECSVYCARTSIEEYQDKRKVTVCRHISTRFSNLLHSFYDCIALNMSIQSAELSNFADLTLRLDFNIRQFKICLLNVLWYLLFSDIIF